MACKAVLYFCVQSILVQVIFGQCIGNALNNVNSGLSGLGGYGSAGLGLSNYGLNPVFNQVGCSNSAGIGFANAGLGFANNAAGLGYGNGLAANSNGGGLTVTSASPIAPTGITVASENAIEGPIAVTAEMPFLSAVAVEGQVQSGGQAATSYSCGDGNVGIVSENVPSSQYFENGIAVGSTSNLIGSGYGAGLGSLNTGFGTRGLGTSGLGLGNQGCGYGASGLGLGARQGFGFGAGLRQGALGNRVL